MSEKITYDGVEYKSKSAAAKTLLNEGNLKKGEIAKELGISYQTVHAIQKKMENNISASSAAKKVITSKNKKSSRKKNMKEESNNQTKENSEDQK